MTTHAHNYLFADACVSLTRMKADDVYYSPLPLFHANAQFLTAYAAMIAGGRYVMGERFSASAWLGAVRECGATHTNLLGVMMDYVWKQPPTSEDADNKLRCVFAAPVNFRIVEEFKKRFDIEAFVDVFGSTEIGIPILTPYNVPRPQGSFGLAMTDLYDMKLVDPETDQEVPAGELGELVIRPKIAWTLTQGYYRRPEATVAAFRNLWFHTGDGLRQDSEGWFYWVDRLKDAIRRKGENISSAEIEQAVLAMDGIIECAAIAVPADEGEGEDEVMLYVVREPGATIEAEAVWAWCDSKVPRFAVPRFIEFIGALPKTPTGKIQKVQLRNLAAAQPRPKERATPSKR